MPLDRRAVAHAERAAGDEIEAIVGEPRDRHVGFDAAALVAELRVDDRADRTIEIVDGEPLQQRERARSAHLVFRERAHVDQRDALAHRAMLGADRVERRTALERRRLDRRRARRREPVRPLPAELVAVDGAGLAARRCIERAAARAARGVGLVGRPRDVVVAAVALDRALVHVLLDRVRRAEAANVERPQVETGIAVDDPVRHHPAGAAGRGDSRRESAAQVEIVELRREADDRLAVGGDRNRTVDQLPDADFVEHRDPRARRFGERREALEVRLQQLGTEIGADAVRAPRRRVVLPAADRERAGLGLQVEACRRDRAASAGCPGCARTFR